MMLVLPLVITSWSAVLFSVEGLALLCELRGDCACVVGAEG